MFPYIKFLTLVNIDKIYLISVQEQKTILDSIIEIRPVVYRVKVVIIQCISLFAMIVIYTENFTTV